MSGDELDRFGEDVEAVHMVRGRMVYQPGDTAQWLYFPETALLSICTRLRSGGWVETNVVGHEGAVGLLEATARGVMASHVRVHAAGTLGAHQPPATTPPRYEARRCGLQRATTRRP